MVGLAKVQPFLYICERKLLNMIVGCDLVDKKLRVSYYNEEGKISLLEVNIPDSEMYNWYETNRETEYKSFCGKSLMPSSSLRLSRFRLEEIVMKYITGDYEKMVYAENKPTITFLDIENEVPDNNEFTYPDKAEYPINVISLINRENVIVLTTLKNIDSSEQIQLENEVNEYFKKKQSNIKIFYRFFPTETTLLNFFAGAILPKLGFITGWNVVNYDWQYIYNRCTKLGVDILGGLPTRTTKGKMKIPTHLPIVDYLDLVISFEALKGDVENYELATVSQKVVGVSKLDNPYNSFREFVNDSHRFILYNIIDSCLVKYIDEKLNIMEAFFSQSISSKIELVETTSSVFVNNILLCREYYEKGLHLPDIRRNFNANSESYSGALLKEPKKGLILDVAQYDYSSMYPNLQVEFGISPETYLGKDESLLVGRQYVKTALGTCFDSSYESASAKILKRFYDERKEIQKLIKEKKKELKSLSQQ